MLPTTKTCSKCELSFTLNEFYHCNTAKDKLQSQCKKCSKICATEYQQLHPEKQKQYQLRYVERSPESFKKSQQKYYDHNKAARIAYQKEYYLKNREARLDYAKEYLKNKK